MDILTDCNFQTFSPAKSMISNPESRDRQEYRVRTATLLTNPRAATQYISMFAPAIDSSSLWEYSSEDDQQAYLKLSSMRNLAADSTHCMFIFKLWGDIPPPQLVYGSRMGRKGLYEQSHALRAVQSLYFSFPTEVELPFRPPSAVD